MMTEELKRSQVLILVLMEDALRAVASVTSYRSGFLS